MAAAIAALAVLALVGGGDRRLGASPFTLSVSPVSDRAERWTIRIEHAGQGAGALARESMDLYLVSVLAPVAMFLTPAGTWSSAPIAVRPGATLDRFVPVEIVWSQPGPPGLILIGLIAVRPSANPLARSAWMYRPAAHWLRVNVVSRPPTTDDVLVLGGLGLVALGGTVILMVYPRSP